jgi:hypothetical protein
MSLINDAMNRARQDHTPRSPQKPLPPPPPAGEPTPVGVWLLPAIVIFLIVAAVFFTAWAVEHHSVQAIVTAPPDPAAARQQATETAAALAVVVPPVPPPPLNPPDAPKLQGIFYSPTAPAAIVDGKTVSVGGHYLQYRVTEITRYTVTLVDPDGKAIKLGMGD